MREAAERREVILGEAICVARRLRVSRLDAPVPAWRDRRGASLSIGGVS
jgi:hypothetical protein